MKSGLRDRNNSAFDAMRKSPEVVSMKSGLRDRNNESPLRLILYTFSMSQ